jgi:hypothetical protein
MVVEGVAMAVKFDNREKLKAYLRSLDRVPVVVPPARPAPAKSPDEAKHGT